MHKLILASKSPRRRKILSEAGYIFSSDSIELSEIINENMNLEDAVQDLARQKAEAYVKANKLLKSQDVLVLSADTIVVIEGRVLGKPKNFAQAREYLSTLSEKTHRVITGFCIYDGSHNKFFMDAEETQVVFRLLSQQEIDDYIATGEPMDKAGAYGIQGEGKKFVREYIGSWNNIVGFPLKKFEAMVSNNGWHINKK